TVTALGEDDLKRVHTREYRRPNMVVAAVGNIKHDDVVSKIARLFEPLPNGKRTVEDHSFGEMKVQERSINKPTAQTHLVVGTRTFGHGDPRRYALVLLSN